MHEDTLSNKKKRQAHKNLYVFGYGLVLIFAFFAWHTHHKHGMSWVVLVLGCLSIFMLGVTLINQVWLKAIYVKWMIGAHFIGTCISGLVLSFIFYFVFAPIGILFRILRKDFLSRSLVKEKSSYWISLEDKPFDPQQCEKQF